MVRVTPKAGAVFLTEESSGPPAGYGCLPSVIGRQGGSVPTGLAMQLDPATDAFRLILLDEANTALLVLGPYAEDDVVAQWRAMAAVSGLTLKIQLTNGTVMTPFPQIGRVQLGMVRIRRRHGLLNGRRPRFLTRRKTGRFALRPQVHGKAELAEGPGF
jgi:Family of unknown function (DUF6101)